MDLIIERQEHDWTLARVLRRRLPTAADGYLRQLLKKGKILYQQHLAQPDEQVSAGEQLHLPGSGRLQELYDQGHSLDVDILLETEDFLVVAKPAGLAVHRGLGHEKDNLAARIERLMELRGQIVFTAPVHRLDAATSGPVLFGKGRPAIARFGAWFSEGRVDKRYLALVRDRLPATGLLDSAVPAKGKIKESQTCFQRLAAANGYALLELQLLSGRKHQIRRQLADVGCPIVGDTRYGGPTLGQLDRLFLHGWQLRLPLEQNGLIRCDLPDNLRHVVEQLGLQFPTQSALSMNDNE